jgi:[acyl-carrier-protein] S-malonyltransferase
LSLVLLFPGQGSQEVGMGQDAAQASAGAREAFEEADDALGFSISKLCFEGPEDALVPTEIQQPAILTASLALYRALLERLPDLAPAYVAGHSLGEYSALVAAGALSLSDAVKLVNLRGRFMQQAVPQGEGAMAAILGASAEDVDAACSDAREKAEAVVTAANYNSPQQTVIAGTAAAVEVACQNAVSRGAKRTVPLAVSAPFHCSLMAPAADALAAELAKIPFADARPAVVTNVEAEPNTAATRMPDLLFKQVTAPVRFTEMIGRLTELGSTHFLEVGPGRVLSGLVARIQRRSKRANLSSLADLEDAVELAKSVETATG